MSTAPGTIPLSPIYSHMGQLFCINPLVGNLPNQLRVRAERLGYASYEGPLVEWAELHTRRIEIGLESQALDIEGLTVRPARRCELETGEGPQLASLWEETRKALRVAVWSMSEGALRFRFTRFDRVLDARGRTVLRQDTEDVDRWTRHPFRSVVADSLSAGGYVVDDPDGDGRLFFAPDLEVLLSDAFLATHCLGLVRDGVRMGFEIEPLNRMSRVISRAFCGWRRARFFPTV